MRRSCLLGFLPVFLYTFLRPVTYGLLITRMNIMQMKEITKAISLGLIVADALITKVYEQVLVLRNGMAFSAFRLID